nr:MAG TPA: hypothetical protein [Caudoviricetes sp.]
MRVGWFFTIWTGIFNCHRSRNRRVNLRLKYHGFSPIVLLSLLYKI